MTENTFQGSENPMDRHPGLTAEILERAARVPLYNIIPGVFTPVDVLHPDHPSHRAFMERENLFLTQDGTYVHLPEDGTQPYLDEIDAIIESIERGTF